MSRIGTLPKPWPDAFAAAMEKVMPPGVEPLSLFTAIAQSPRAWDRFSAGSMAGKGPLDFRTREIVINRTAARTGCEYEWGTHTKLFAAKAGLTPAQVRSTYDGHADDGNWTEAEAAAIATVDALLANKRLSDREFARIAAHFDTAQILEIIQLTSFYHGVALITGALDLPCEPGMDRFPT
jgi:alkylhydroperoxidase family enzyme